jgi:hypothetical protein
MSGSNSLPKEVKNGAYELEVPDGVYAVYADLSVLYNGQNYNIELHPTDGVQSMKAANVQDRRRSKISRSFWDRAVRVKGFCRKTISVCRMP